MKKKNVVITMIILMIIALGAYFIANTYAKYSSTATGSGTVSVAKWAVKLNTEDITQEETFDLTFTQVKNDNVVAGKIAPGTQMYADLVIDPAGSEVSMNYQLSLGDLSDTPVTVVKVVPCNVDAQGKVTEGKDALVADEGGNYKGTISLKDQKALTSKEAVTVRVYVEWANADANNATDTATGIEAGSLTIPVDVTVSQLVK